MKTPRSLFRLALAALLFLGVGLTACDSAAPIEDLTPADPFVTYEVNFDPSSFQSAITNPFFPLQPGTVSRFEAQKADGLEVILFEVLTGTRVVAGVTATVVRDRVFVDSVLVEDTFDWFAQDRAGNVWYLGEETQEYEDGVVVSTSGSWEAGVDGARAGIIMPAQPTVGQAYYQEFYEGEAEDRARVLSTNEAVTVPYGSFTGCVMTEDTTPLQPFVLEYKYYCPGVGTTLEVDGDERVELVSVE